MSTSLTVAMPLQEMQILARAIAASGLFGIKTPDAALVLMAIAQAEGRHPVEAARDYDIINNRPAKKAEAMLRDFIKAGGTMKWHSLTDELADATFTHPQTGEVRIDWDMKRAQTAFGTKDMYTKFPRQMLRSRVVSEGVRTLWPLATSGMYVPEEAADIPTKEHNGPTLEAETDEMPVAPIRAAAAATQRAPRIAERVPAYETPPKPTPEMPEREAADTEAWLQRLRTKAATAISRDEVAALEALPSVKTALQQAPQWVKDEINAALINAFARVAEPQDEAPADELEIRGADKLAAG